MLFLNKHRGQPILEALSIPTACTQTNYAESLAQARDIPVPNDLQTINIPQRIEALCQTLYQHPKWGQEPNVGLLFIPQSPSEPLRQVKVQARLKREVRALIGCKLST